MAISGGILGSIEGTTTTYKTLYKPASGVLAVVSLSALNRSAATKTIRISITQDAGSDPTPIDGDFLVYNTTLAAAGDTNGKDKLSISSIVLNGTNNDQLVVYTSGVDVDFSCSGVTETI